MRTLYIIRGLPGSGKSTLAQKLTPYNCAADDWMVDSEGNYSFDPQKLAHCHSQCQVTIESYMRGCTGTIEMIAVHNTFVKKWEAKPYLDLAAKYGYSVVVLECQSDFGNIHGVPPEAIQRMKQNWEKSIL